MAVKIILTGSHFTPAQAVIEELRRNYDVELVYIGRKHTLEGDQAVSAESKLLPSLGVKFRAIITGRLQRSFSRYTIPSLLKIPIGFVQAFYYLVQERPEVVLSFGGYVSVPVVISAWLLSIPVVVHEQTLVTSLANRIGAILADKICVSFHQEYGFPQNKIVYSGNPIRDDLISPPGQVSHEVKEALALAKKANLRVILVMGGNQGSHVINQAIGQILEQLTEKAVIIHSSGDSKFNDFESLSTKRQILTHPERYLVQKWLGQNLGHILRASDLAVSRAGANSLNELNFFGVPTLAIPLPYLNHNEQTVNARYYQKLGLVEVLDQADLTGQRLFEEIMKLLERTKKDRRRPPVDMAKAVKAAAIISQQTVFLATSHG